VVLLRSSFRGFRGVALRKLFNHLHKEHTRPSLPALPSIGYQSIVTPSILHRAVQDAGRHYALVVCESSSFPPLLRAISNKGVY